MAQHAEEAGGAAVAAPVSIAEAPPQADAQHAAERQPGPTSSKGRTIKRTSKTDSDSWMMDDSKYGEEPTSSKGYSKGHSRGRWDGAISPRTPGFMPPLETLPPVTLPKLPGGGGIFKCAAVAVLREEKRLMSTGEVARLALKRGYIRCQGKTPEATMASALYTDVKKKGDNSVFTRPEEGLFGLREWEPHVAAAALANAEPLPLAPKAAKRPRDNTSPKSADASAAVSKPVASKPAGAPSAKPGAQAQAKAAAGAPKPPAGADGKPPKAKPSNSVDENLLLLLDAADELEQEAVVSAKRRKSETGDSFTSKKAAAATKIKSTMGRTNPIQRPAPLQLPIFPAWDYSAAIFGSAFGGKLPSPAPPTPGGTDEAMTSPSMSAAAAGHAAGATEASPSHDSAASSRHVAGHEVLRGAAPAMPRVAEEGDAVSGRRSSRRQGNVPMDESSESSTSSDDSDDDAHAGPMPESSGASVPSIIGLPKPISLPMNQTGLPQVGHMLAAGQFAARLIQANALISQLEQVFGRRHPLVGKAYMAKARICQVEGSRLSLLEAEQAILQARNILHATSDAQEEVMYLLNSIRHQAFVLSQCQIGAPPANVH